MLVCVCCHVFRSLNDQSWLNFYGLVKFESLPLAYHKFGRQNSRSLWIRLSISNLYSNEGLVSSWKRLISWLAIEDLSENFPRLLLKKDFKARLCNFEAPRNPKWVSKRSSTRPWLWAWRNGRLFCLEPFLLRSRRRQKRQVMFQNVQKQKLVACLTLALKLGLRAYFELYIAKFYIF